MLTANAGSPADRWNSRVTDQQAIYRMSYRANRNPFDNLRSDSFGQLARVRYTGADPLPGESPERQSSHDCRSWRTQNQIALPHQFRDAERYGVAESGDESLHHGVIRQQSCRAR